MFQILINIFWLIKIKRKEFGDYYHNHIVIMSELNCFKPFYSFYYTDTKDIVFV